MNELSCPDMARRKILKRFQPIDSLHHVVLETFRMRSVPRSQSTPSPPSNTGGQYFDRRGEVNELKQGLRSAIAERNPESLRDNIRKVIMYMTLGIDMSRLFSEMVMVSQMGDTVQKKMVYLYLTTYADQNADLAILAVNTLQKDTKDVDPSVRGLALRSLCSLQLLNIVEYLEPAIRSGLSDPSGYVRKTAVLGVLKLSNVSSNISPFIDQLKSMLSSDSDPMVVSNCISALSQLDALAPLVDQTLVYQLLTRIPHLSEWGRCEVLDSVVSKYYPQDEEELFNLMNVLDPYLRQSSGPVSFSIVKLFLNWTMNQQELYDQVLERVVDPIISLLSASCACQELQASILLEIELLVNMSDFFKSLVSPHWKRFCLTDSDTVRSSRVKLRILSSLSAPEVLTEVSSYIQEPRLSKHAVEALVHLMQEPDVPRAVDLLMETAQIQPSVAGYCMWGIGSIFRKYSSVEISDFTERILTKFLSLDQIESESDKLGLETLAFMFGEYPEWENAPYQLERLFEYMSTLAGLESVKKLVFSSSVRLFHKRPLEVRDLLERVLRYGIDECSDPDTRDVALFHFRQLRTLGPQEPLASSIM